MENEKKYPVAPLHMWGVGGSNMIEKGIVAVGGLRGEKVKYPDGESALTWTPMILMI